MTAPGMSRRRLCSLSTLTLAVGVAGAAATTAAGCAVFLDDGCGLSADDADLLRVCADFDAIEARRHALGDDRDEALALELGRQQRPLLDQMCSLRACTPAGLRARAKTLAHYTPALLDPRGGYVDQRMIAALLRDLVEGAVA